MIEISTAELLFSLMIGVLLGSVFFGGLRYTVSKLATSKSQPLLLVGSFFLRFAVVLAVFYWLITALHWQALLFALPGLILARQVICNRGYDWEASE